MIPFIVFDTEITGLGDDAGICEIAIHGIDNGMVANAPIMKFTGYSAVILRFMPTTHRLTCACYCKAAGTV